MKGVDAANRIRRAIRFEARQDDYILELLGDNVELVDAGGRTLIFHAILSKRDELVAKLIGKGSSVRHSDSEGRTPLHLAVQEQRCHDV